MIWFFLCTVMFLELVKANTYLLVFESSIKKCESDKSLDNVFDSSNVELQVEGEEGDFIVLNGNVSSVYEFPPDSTLTLKASLEKNDLGTWVKQPFFITYLNFCSQLFEESSVWFDVVKHFTGDQRVCPPKKGVSLL